MVVRVAINGLGRIGRLVLRRAFRNKGIDICAVNDLIHADNLAYLLKYDSTHGRFEVDVKAKNDQLDLDGKRIRVLNEKEPSNLPWKELGIDYVIESTGRFTKAADASAHLQAGAKRVIISAPSEESVPTYVMGVNHTRYNPNVDKIVSNASCTTNCLAPITKVLLDHFGIEEGLMTTIHAMTAGQATVDGPSKKDWRRGRGAHQNIVPASTGATRALGLCIPELKGKITGMAFRVPVADVSVVDLTVRLSQPTTYEMICQKMQQEACGAMEGILQYSEEPVVSSDFVGSYFSAIFDAIAGIALNDFFFKIVAWYDNEMGYASRIVDLINYMAKQEQRVLT